MSDNFMERDLVENCKEVYNKLESIYNENRELGNEDTIKEMFKAAGGSTLLTQRGNNIIYTGSVIDGYSIGGTIDINNSEQSYYTLIEDLIMGYYIANNGKLYTKNAKDLFAEMEVKYI